MRFEFSDSHLEAIYTEKHARSKLPPEVIKKFRKAIQLISGASDLRDIRQIGGFHFEKLAGDRTGQHSMKLNKQWRLICQITKDCDGSLLLVLEIVDYH